MKGTFNLLLVAVSYGVSVFGSYVGLMLASRITDLRDNLDRACLVGAAVALGGGAIWSMHFIGMLAYQAPVPVAYDFTLTILSMLVAILFTGIGVYLVIRQPQMRFSTLVVAGVVMGLGVAAMHYTGMASIQMAGHANHDMTIVALSIAIAVVASIVALWIAVHVRQTLLRIGSALVMGLAVCGMHYTAMFGFSMLEDSTAQAIPPGGIAAVNLAMYVAITAVALLLVSLLLVFAKEIQATEQRSA